jgi:membrane-bound lytic murein transglycosylase D
MLLVPLLLLAAGCALTGKRNTVLPPTQKAAADKQRGKTATVPAAAGATASLTNAITSKDSAASQDSGAVADPEWLIEQAKSLCAGKEFAAADSALRRAVRSIETIDADNEGNEEWFPSTRYIDDIVSIYSTQMPPQFPLPEDIALTALQRQMGKSLDSISIMPAESLALAGAACVNGTAYDVPMVWNDRVQRALLFYLKNRKYSVDRWFYRANYYLPVMRKMFADSGLPKDLAYLPLIESGFNPLAYSYAHASGIWQFIASTGKLYGLRHSYWLDERRDPIKSTTAAIRYLKKLYGDFGDWHLALAAYNCGENGVSYAINRCKHNDFWRLRLPLQTRCYVPFYLAAVTLAKNQRLFKVDKPAVSDTFSLDTVHVNDCIALSDIAQGTGIPLDTLRSMNPQFLRWCTPPDVTDAVLYLPKGQAVTFREFSAALPQAKKIRWCRYEIKQNDNIPKIAKEYRIAANAVKEINRLKTDKLTAGHFLFLPEPGTLTDSSVATLPPLSASPDDDDFSDATQYIIKKGDSISKIARMFHVSYTQLYRLNHITNRTLLYPGRLLLIRSSPRSAPAAAPVAVKQPADSLMSGAFYVVRSNDCPIGIATRAGITLNDLISWNRLDPRAPMVHPGDTVRIRNPAADTLASVKKNLPPDSAALARKDTLGRKPIAVAQKDSGSNWAALLQEKTDSASLRHDTIAGLKRDASTAAAKPLPAGHVATIAPLPGPSMPDWTAALDDGGKHNRSAPKGAPPPQRRYYIVKPGDNLFRIAKELSVRLQALASINHLHRNDFVHPGDSLIIPPGGGMTPERGKERIVFYKVKDGDTLRRIAATFGISLEDLSRFNHLHPDSALAPGKVIKVKKAGSL